MWWVFVILVLGAACIAYGVYRHNKEKKESEEEEKLAETPDRPLYLDSKPVAPPKPVPPVPKKKDEKSLDRQFAEQNGMWICPYCETLNVNSSACCAACGSNRT